MSNIGRVEGNQEGLKIPEALSYSYAVYDQSTKKWKPQRSAIENPLASAILNLHRLQPKLYDSLFKEGKADLLVTSKGVFRASDNTPITEDQSLNARLQEAFTRTLNQLGPTYKANAEEVQIRLELKKPLFIEHVKKIYHEQTKFHAQLLNAKKKMDHPDWIEANNLKKAEVISLKQDLAVLIKESQKQIDTLHRSLQLYAGQNLVKALDEYAEELYDGYSTFAKALHAVLQYNHLLEIDPRGAYYQMSAFPALISTVMEEAKEKGITYGDTSLWTATSERMLSIKRRYSLHTHPELVKTFSNQLSQIEKALNQIQSPFREKDLIEKFQNAGMGQGGARLVYSQLNKAVATTRSFLSELKKVQSLLEEEKLQEAFNLYETLMREKFPQCAEILLHSQSLQHLVSRFPKVQHDLKELSQLPILFHDQFEHLGEQFQAIGIRSSTWSSTHFQMKSKITEMTYDQKPLYLLKNTIGSSNGAMAESFNQLESTSKWRELLTKYGISQKDLRIFSILNDAYGVLIKPLMEEKEAIDFLPVGREKSKAKEAFRNKLEEAIPDLNELTREFKRIGGKEKWQALRNAMAEYQAFLPQESGFQPVAAHMNSFEAKRNYLGSLYASEHLRRQWKEDSFYNMFVQNSLIAADPLLQKAFLNQMGYVPSNESLRKFSHLFESYAEATEPLYLALQQYRENPHHPLIQENLRKTFEKTHVKIQRVRHEIEKLNTIPSHFQQAINEYKELLKNDLSAATPSEKILIEYKLEILEQLPNYGETILSQDGLYSTTKNLLQMPMSAEQGGFEHVLAEIEQAGLQPVWNEALKKREVDSQSLQSFTRLFSALSSGIKDFYKTGKVSKELSTHLDQLERFQEGRRFNMLAKIQACINDTISYLEKKNELTKEEKRCLTQLKEMNILHALKTWTLEVDDRSRGWKKYAEIIEINEAGLSKTGGQR